MIPRFDPRRGGQINLLEMLFEHMPMGIAIIDRDFILRRCNPTWATFIGQYTPSMSVDVVPGANIFDLEPGAEDVLIPLFNRVFDGETIRQDAVRIETGGITSYWDIVLSPVYEKDNVVGLLNVSIDATERVVAEQALQETLLTLEQRVEERTQEAERRRKIAESLRDILKMVNSNIPLDVLMEKAVQLVLPRLGASAFAQHRFDLEKQLISHEASFGMPDGYEKGVSIPLADLQERGGMDYLQAALRKQPTFGNYGPLPDRISEIENDPAIPADIKAQRIALRKRYAASMAIPLIIQDEVYGGMVFYYTEPQVFSEEQVQLAMTFADQMALAIENAKLYEQATDMAAMSERNRLARDLHDAVTQTLFSASLVADVLPKLWERDPVLGRQKLEELRMLTRGALSEMRTLLLELRPDTLGDAEPEELLRYLCNAFTGRTHIPVTLKINGQAKLNSDVKKVFYRIVQESLNNIAKHAEATQVNLNLVLREDRVEVRIQDNGCGFDLATLEPGNLGLKIMHERAEAIGGELNIVSNLGEGTQINLLWKTEKEKHS